MNSIQKAQLKEELTKQLISLSTSSGASCSNFLDITKKQNDEMSAWHKAIMRITQAIRGLNEYSTFFVATIFLSAYEINYVSTLDRVCFLYIKNGHDLYDSLHNKFAKNFDDIGKLNTFVKFQFLKEHGLSILVRENDNELRNKIAHLDFSIESEGKIRVRNDIINVSERLVELYDFVTDANLAYAEAQDNLTADLKRRTEELLRKTEELKNIHK